MSFDFSQYDYDEPVDETPGKSGKVAKPVPQLKLPKSTGEFDFSAYDYDEPEAAKPKSKNPFETKPVSSEDYKKMSISEKIQYAKDLEKEQRYESSKSFTKNLASGLTFGATENIDALKPEEGEDPAAAFAGQALGAALPITGAAKAVGYGLKGVTSAIQNGPKILQGLNRLAHAFGTGSLYESGKQGVNAASGKEVDLAQIPKTGAEFATLDAFIRGAGALGKKFLKLSPAHQATIFEEQIIPKDLPKSQYETAEEMLKLVQQQRQANPFPTDNFPPPPPPGGSSPSLNNRVRPGGEDLGLRPVPQRTNPPIQDTIGNIFSPNRFYNTTQGGHALRNEIMNIDEDVYRGVNALYRRSRELNSAIEDIHPQLVNRLQTRIAELDAIPEPSDVQRRLLRASQNILNDIATVGENGEITGFRPINNQILIDQVQSLRQIIDYDFAHGNTKNIFRPLINELQDSALRSAENSATPEAAAAINEARNAYRMWVEAFDNDYVRPFRDASNQDYSKLFKSSLDLDESNMLRRILETTPRGQELTNASTREIVEKHLSKFFENPRDHTGREFDKAVRELEAVITPDQAQQVREQFRQASARPNIRAREQPKRPPTNDERIAAKYEGKEPEDIQKMMNSRSGIKKLREDFNDTPKKREVFDRMTKQKMRSILREGNIEKDFSGDDLYKFLNKEHNYELFSEILGETETEALRQSAKEIGQQQVKSEVRKKNLSKAAHKVAAYKTFEILLNLF